jgi:hypothetical protein
VARVPGRGRRQIERFDRIIAAAPADASTGFSPKELTWILTHAPAEALILRTSPRPHQAA